MTNKEKYFLVKFGVKGPPLPPRDGRPPRLPKKKPVEKTLKPPKDGRPPRLPETKPVKKLPKPPKDGRPPQLPKTKSVKKLPKPPKVRGASGPPLLPMSGSGGGHSGSRGSAPRGAGARMGYLRGSPGSGGSYGSKPHKYL